MYIFTPNTLLKSSEVNANFAELLTSKTTDANGWTIYDYKASGKVYRKRVTFSQNIGGAVAIALSSSNLPSGMSTLGTNYCNVSCFIPSGNAYGLHWNPEMGTGSAGLNITATGASITYTGFFDWEIVT